MLACCLALGPQAARAQERDNDGGSAGVDDDAAFATLRRQVIVSEILIAPRTAFATPAAMLTALHKLATREIFSHDGFWRFHLVAFLEPPPETAEVRAVLTDVTEPDRPHEVKVFELDVEPGARALAVNNFVVTEAMGFAHGHDYELAVTQRGAGDEARNGKAAVLARAVVTLK